MLAAKGFRDMARPANGLVMLEGFGNHLEPNLTPRDGLLLWSQQGGRVAGPFLDIVHRFVAKNAGLALTPFRDDALDQATLAQSFDLLQAILCAILLFRPA